VALLTAEPFDLGDSHAFDAHFTQGIFNFIEFERFDDRLDLRDCFGFGRPSCQARDTHEVEEAIAVRDHPAERAPWPEESIEPGSDGAP